MQNLHLLRRYIREAIDMGETQFSPYRVDRIDRRGKPVDTSELNTPKEAQLYHDLVARLDASAPLSQATAKIIIDLLDSKYGQAPGGSGFFSEPPLNEMLYRGHGMSLEWLKKHVSPEEIEMLTSNAWKTYRRDDALVGMVNRQKFIQLKVPYQFDQSRGWSKDPKIAATWAIKYAAEKRDEYGIPGVAVVLVTTPADSDTRFLDLDNNMYNTALGVGYVEEKECINLGPVTIKEAAIVIL